MLTYQELLEHTPKHNHAAFNAIRSVSDTQIDLDRAESHDTLRYFAAINDNREMVGFLRAGEWFSDDQIAFESTAKIIRHKLRVKREPRPLPRHPMGIHALTIDGKFSVDERLQATEMLLDSAIDHASGREVRMPLFSHAFGEVHWSAVRSGFQHMGKSGFVGHVQRDLYIRPGIAPLR